MFLDCFTCSTLDVEIADAFIKGVTDGCKISNCALVGGETAEMPGLLNGKRVRCRWDSYRSNRHVSKETDLAGYAEHGRG